MNPTVISLLCSSLNSIMLMLFLNRFQSEIDTSRGRLYLDCSAFVCSPEYFSSTPCRQRMGDDRPKQQCLDVWCHVSSVQGRWNSSASQFFLPFVIVNLDEADLGRNDSKSKLYMSMDDDHSFDFKKHRLPTISSLRTRVCVEVLVNWKNDRNRHVG